MAAARRGPVRRATRPGERDRRDGPRLLAPVVPSKIVCIGLNYKDHAAEQNKPLPAEPLMFIKPSTAVVGPGEPIVLPRRGRPRRSRGGGRRRDRRAARRDVREADARSYVLGLTCVNDVTARELQEKDVQYTRAKGFDTFAPIGPCIAAGLDYRAPGGHRRRGLGQRRAAAGVVDRAADLLRSTSWSRSSRR